MVWNNFIQTTEQNEPEKQTLRLNLSRNDKQENIRRVVGGALKLLKGEKLEDFKKILDEAITEDSNKGYDDFLAIANAHLGGGLIDTSGTHPDYAEGAQD